MEGKRGRRWREERMEENNDEGKMERKETGNKSKQRYKRYPT